MSFRRKVTLDAMHNYSGFVIVVRRKFPALLGMRMNMARKAIFVG
jgi:hypothetical protein